MTTPLDPNRKPAEQYLRQIEQFDQRLVDVAPADRRLTIVRIVLFLALATSFLVAFLTPEVRVAANSVGTFLLAVFVIVAAYHERISLQKEEWTHRQSMAREQLGRLRHHWSEINVHEVEVPSEHTYLAKDLDLFGEASLYHLISMAHTPRGKEILREWLLSPATPPEILERQAAVRELAAEVSLREELALRGRMLSETLAGPDRIVAWATGPTWLSRRPWILWVARGGPLVMLAALLAMGIGWLDPTSAAVVVVAVLALNILLSVLFSGAAHDIFNQISSRSREVRHYRYLFDLFVSQHPQAEWLRRIHRDAVEGEHGALRCMHQLERLMMLAYLRYASLLSILYLLFQVAALWDFHILARVERWQTLHGRNVAAWFEALGKFEAIASLANLHYNEPQWCFPELHSEPLVEATALGHALIAAEVRVCNDVTVGPRNTVLLVTGSNMSGKSTLLRSLGVNVTLAQCGSVVCAHAMKLPPLEITTSMRISDSLAAGVSFYMAELKRLKEIVDRSHDYSARDDRFLFYLLDEILQGTNSTERHIAVTRVLRHLLDRGAIGAVSTHDLQLATSPELQACCHTVHFRETIERIAGKQTMTFDYRMRQGVATTTNALKLLEMVGLGDEPTDTD